MPLNKSRGNMYPFVTHTFNPIRGCNNDCVYCYVKSIYDYDMTPRFVEKELEISLGSDKYIFVGSTSDMFGEWVPVEWIIKVLEHCCKYPENKYLFQTRNPERVVTYLDKLPPQAIIGTTIETNRNIEGITRADKPFDRFWGMLRLVDKVPLMVSIEPIIDFDLITLKYMIEKLKPEFVAIGADSKNSDLPEPSKDKIAELIDELTKITKVVKKENLHRLLQGDN